MNPVVVGAIFDALAPMLFAVAVIVAALLGSRGYPPKTRRTRLIIAAVIAFGAVVAAVVRFIAAL